MLGVIFTSPSGPVMSAAPCVPRCCLSPAVEHVPRGRVRWWAALSVLMPRRDAPPPKHRSAPRQSATRGAFPTRMWQSRGGCFSGDSGAWGSSVGSDPAGQEETWVSTCSPFSRGGGPWALLLALLLVTSPLAVSGFPASPVMAHVTGPLWVAHA